MNRMLQSFQDKGWVSIRGGEITLTNVPELRVAAQEGARLRDFTA